LNCENKIYGENEMTENKMNIDNLAEYTLVLTDEGAVFNGWKKNFAEVKTMVQVVWSGRCTEKEAFERLDALVRKQVAEIKELKSAKWRVVRLYDEQGKQIGQEN